MRQYFKELYEYSIGNVKSELDLSNYTAVRPIRKEEQVSRTDFAYLSKLYNVVDNDLVNKTIKYNHKQCYLY